MVVVLPKKFPCLSRIAFPACDDGHLTRVPNGQWVADPLKGGVSSMRTGRNVGSSRIPYRVGFDDQPVSVTQQILYDIQRTQQGLSYMFTVRFDHLRLGIQTKDWFLD